MGGLWERASVADCLVPVRNEGQTKVLASNYKRAGRFPIIDQGQERIAGWTDDESTVIDAPLPLIIFGDHTRTFKFVDRPFARGADGTQLLRPKHGIDPLFFFYACRAIDLPARGYSRHFTTLKEKEIAFPRDGVEQAAIAGVLYQAERASRKQSEILNALDALKSATMHQLFTRGLRAEAQRETEVGLVPGGWQVGPLENLARFQRGFDITKSTQTHGDIPVVSSGGIRSYHNLAAATGPGLVIGRKGSIGQLYYLEREYWPHDTTLWCTDFKGNVPKFVYYRLQIVDIKKLDSGAANPALNRNYLHAELVSWPDPAEQKSIVAILDAIEEKIDAHRKKRVVLDELFRSLLHQLMTGEITVLDLDPSALTSRSLQIDEVTA